METVTRSYRDNTSRSIYPVKPLPSRISRPMMSDYMARLPMEIRGRTLALRGRKEAREAVALNLPGVRDYIGEDTFLSPPEPFSIVSLEEFNKATKGKYNVIGFTNGLVKIVSKEDAMSVVPMNECTYYLPFGIPIPEDASVPVDQQVPSMYSKSTSTYRERILTIYNRAVEVYGGMGLRHVYVVESESGLIYEFGQQTRVKTYKVLIIESNKVYDGIVLDTPTHFMRPMVRGWGGSNSKERAIAKAKYYRENSVGPVIMEAVRAATKTLGQLYLSYAPTPHYGYRDEGSKARVERLILAKRQRGEALTAEERLPFYNNRMYKLVGSPVTQTMKDLLALAYKNLTEGTERQVDEYWALTVEYSINHNTSTRGLTDSFNRSDVSYYNGNDDNKCAMYTLSPEAAKIVRPLYFSQLYMDYFDKTRGAGPCLSKDMTPEAHSEQYRMMILKDLNGAARVFPQSYIGILFPK